MKKFLLIFSFSFVVFHSQAQNYEWRPIIPGLDCNDSSYQECFIGNFVTDTFHNVLWVTGFFNGAGGIQSPYCVGFNGTNWIAFPGVMDSTRAGSINKAIMYNGDLIICRNNTVEKFSFTTNQWTTIGTASNGVFCLGIYNGDLIAAGGFFQIDGVFANSIARWDGAQWYALGGGIAGSSHVIYDLQSYHGNLYAAGAFDYADSIDAWNIAVWDGINWNNLCSSGGSFGTDKLSGNHFAADVLDIEVFNDKLYITGKFEKVCGINCYLAYWDDTTWHGTNYGGEGNKLIVVNNRLIVRSPAGPFLFYSDNVTPTGVDTGFAGGDNDEAVFQNILYAGGGFINSGNTQCFRIARLMINNHVYVSEEICEGNSYNFNGVLLDSSGIYTDTLTDASGLDSIVVLTLTVTAINASISISNDTLFATGNGTVQWYDCNAHQFVWQTFGNIFVPAITGNYAAVITNNGCSDTTNCISVTVGIDEINKTSYLKIFPNPVSEQLIIDNVQLTIHELEITDVLGRTVALQTTNNHQPTTNIDVSALATGIYFIKARCINGTVEVARFVKE